MVVDWKVLLSYDAKAEFYNIINEDVDFSKIREEANDFLTSLIMLLLHNGAYELQSTVESTILFKVNLEPGQTPPEYFDDIFNKAFPSKTDFRFMLLSTVNQNDYSTFSTNNEMSLHSANFQLKVEKSRKLLERI